MVNLIARDMAVFGSDFGYDYMLMYNDLLFGKVYTSITFLFFLRKYPLITFFS